jgi:hypothetical protein
MLWYDKLLRNPSDFGEVAEWLKAQHWKCCLGVTLTRVRIPPSPFLNLYSLDRQSGEVSWGNLRQKCIKPLLLFEQFLHPWMIVQLGKSLALGIIYGE